MQQKAERQLNLLQRLSKSVNTRLVIFKSFIRSNFTYCPIVWHFCSQTNSEKLEKLQFRTLHIVFNDASYEDLLSRVKMTTLHLNRIKNIAKKTYKCLKGTVGKGAIRKRFPLQKPRWEKTKLTIRYLYHETYRKPNEQLFSQ